MDGPKDEGFLTKRKCLIGLGVLFVLVAIFIAAQPYDPMTGDIADATTNAIWTEQYSNGVYEIPYENWTYGMTQSVVVDHDGKDVVVNEKGPGLVIMLVPFHVLGVEFLFGPLMAAIAVLSTYMLALRLTGNWRIGVLSSLMVLLNVSVIVMWFRYYWTDAATMHLLILSIWLTVESIHRFNGRSLDLRTSREATWKDRSLGILFAVLAGTAFGVSVSTRYPVGLIVIAVVLYIMAFLSLKAWNAYRDGGVRSLLKEGRGIAVLIAFAIGLSFIMVPLMDYNSEYFGGPFRSGYDAQSLQTFGQTHTTTARNQSISWMENLGEGVKNAARNVVSVGPTILFRMPALLLAPLGLWYIRKDRPATILFIVWISIGLFTYLSLVWIDRYAGWEFILNRAHEPRYFMPVIPASAILGGIAIDRIAFGKHPNDNGQEGPSTRRAPSLNRVNGLIVAGVLVSLIAIPGIYPAAVHFSNPELIMPKERPDNGIGQNAPFLTTDQILADPMDVAEKPVRVRDAEVISISRDVYQIRSVGSVDGTISLRLIEWPEDKAPDIEVGDRLEIGGIFRKVPGSQGYELTVKWGTIDYVRTIK